ARCPRTADEACAALLRPGRVGRELGRGHADAASLADTVQQPRVEPVPAARGERVEAVRMPEDRERTAVCRRPVEQPGQARLGALRREPEIALLGEGRVHRRERDRSEEHTSELQSLAYLVCRLL